MAERDSERKPLHIDTHRALIGRRRKVIAALSERPELLPLLALNPVLAFRDAGVTLSPEMASHVLSTLQFPPAIRAERDELAVMLRKELGVLPRPTQPAWMAETLFKRLGLTPLSTEGATATYRNPIPEDALERLQALLPSRREGRPGVFVSTSAPLVKVPSSVLHLDLGAPVPALPALKQPPAEVSLEELWFYRDAHPLVTPLLRLGIIERGGLRILTPDAYRKAKSGKTNNDLLTWVTDVRFPADGRR